MTSMLKQLKAKVEAGGQTYISLKCALMAQADLKEFFDMDTIIVPWSIHPQYGQLYILKFKEAN